MRHRNHSSKLNRTSSHRRCLMANMLKSLVLNGRVLTTVAKAKSLRVYADKAITLAKKGDLAAKRRLIAQMMVRYNKLTPKEARKAKEGDTSSYNGDRQVMKILDELGTRFAQRQGGYTRITRAGHRVGDAATLCYLEYLDS